MGIFDFFIDRSVKKKIANDPIYISALKASESALQETNLYKITTNLEPDNYAFVFVGTSAFSNNAIYTFTLGY